MRGESQFAAWHRLPLLHGRLPEAYCDSGLVCADECETAASRFNLEAGNEALEEQSLETKINDVQAQTLEEQPVKGSLHKQHKPKHR